MEVAMSHIFSSLNTSIDTPPRTRSYNNSSMEQTESRLDKRRQLRSNRLQLERGFLNMLSRQ